MAALFQAEGKGEGGRKLLAEKSWSDWFQCMTRIMTGEADRDCEFDLFINSIFWVFAVVLFPYWFPIYVAAVAFKAFPNYHGILQEILLQQTVN